MNIYTYSFFHKQTGTLHSKTLLTSDPTIVPLNTPPEHEAIEGTHDHRFKRVDLQTRQVVDLATH